jgi:hypothetical protein
MREREKKSFFMKSFGIFIFFPLFVVVVVRNRGKKKKTQITATLINH